MVPFTSAAVRSLTNWRQIGARAILKRKQPVGGGTVGPLKERKTCPTVEEEEERNTIDWLPILESHACYWEPIGVPQVNSDLIHRRVTIFLLRDRLWNVGQVNRYPRHILF